MPYHSSRTSGASAAAAMRSFYANVLGGREVWPSEAGDDHNRRWFFIGARLIEVTLSNGAERPTLMLEVDKPDEVAERCWDAGFSVQVHADVAGRPMLSVVDPAGRQIVLVPRATRFAS